MTETQNLQPVLWDAYDFGRVPATGYVTVIVNGHTVTINAAGDVVKVVK